MTFTRLLERVRVETARKWLQSTDCSIADIAVSEISMSFFLWIAAWRCLKMGFDPCCKILHILRVAHFLC